MKKRCGEEAIKQFLNIQDSSKNADFIKKLLSSLNRIGKKSLTIRQVDFSSVSLLSCNIVSKRLRIEYPVPQHVLETIADIMLPDIRTFFESEEGKREFEE